MWKKNGINAFFGGVILKNINNNEWEAMIYIFLRALGTIFFSFAS